MNAVIFILFYLVIGLVLELNLSKEPNLWPVFVWPFLLIALIIVCIIESIKEVRK